MPSSPRARVVAVAVVTCLLTLAVSGVVQAQLRARIGAKDVTFNLAPPAQSANPMIASGVGVGSGVDLYFSSGTGPSVVNSAGSGPYRYAPAGTSAADLTYEQGLNALRNVRANLESQGLTLADVISMRVFLQAPPDATVAQFAGFNNAYRKFMANLDRRTGEVVPAYAPVEFENNARPSRSLLEVANLPVSGWLVEIEVVAAYPPNRRHE